MRELVALVVVVVCVVFCGVLGVQYLAGELEAHRVDRLSAQVQLEQARSDRLLVAAQAASERASAERLNSDQAHRQFLELVPVLLVVAGCAAVGGLVLCLLLLVWRSVAVATSEPAALPVVRVLVLPVPMAGESRVEYWRLVSAAAVRELITDQVDQESR